MFSLLVALAAVLLIPSVVADLKMVCYFTNWAQYRDAGGKYLPEDVNASLCTHVMFAFARISGGILTPTGQDDMGNQGMYQRLQKTKQSNPALKIMVSVGGWYQGSQGFSEVVSTESNMDKFAKNTTRWLRETGFDGLDIDWEYPGHDWSGSRPEHKHNFTVLIRKLRAAFDDEAAATGKDTLLLTAAVGVGKTIVHGGYEVSELGKLLDFVDLMTYDFHGGWERQTGAHTALYPRADETVSDQELNVDWAVNHFLQLGLPAEKLVVGLSSYGRGFSLKNPSETNMGDSSRGFSAEQPITRNKGIMSYYEICRQVKNGWTAKFHPEHQVMYAYEGDQWISYDNVKTIAIKAQYIKDKGLAGGMLWSLDLDDFNGSFCGDGTYPLLTAVVNSFKENGDLAGPKKSRGSPRKFQGKFEENTFSAGPPSTSKASLKATSSSPDVQSSTEASRAPTSSNANLNAGNSISSIQTTTGAGPISTSKASLNATGNIPNIQTTTDASPPPITSNVNPDASNSFSSIQPTTAIDTPSTDGKASLKATKGYPKIETTTDISPPSTTKASLKVTDSIPEFDASKCTATGQKFEVTDNCGDYFECTSPIGGLRRSCPRGLHFDPNIDVCNWPNAANRQDCGESILKHGRQH